MTKANVAQKHAQPEIAPDRGVFDSGSKANPVDPQVSDAERVLSFEEWSHSIFYLLLLHLDFIVLVF
jgi:hypothetical protein